MAVQSGSVTGAVASAGVRPAGLESAGVGASEAAEAAAAGAQAVRRAFGDRLPSEHDLVVMFATVEYETTALYAAAVEAAAPARVVGCTATGSLTHEVQVKQGCVAAVLRGDGRRYGVCHVAREDE